MEEERVHMREAQKAASHEMETLRLRMEKEAGEWELKEQHATKQRTDMEERMVEAKRQMEEEREAAKARVQDVTERLEGQVCMCACVYRCIDAHTHERVYLCVCVYVCTHT